MSQRAITHLETAETAILSYLQTMFGDDLDEGDPGPPTFPMLFAVLRALERALGVLEADEGP